LSKETRIEACGTSETYKLRSIELTKKYFVIIFFRAFESRLHCCITKPANAYTLYKIV